MELHPLLVHFPIALIVAAALLDWVRWFGDRPRLLADGFWSGTTPLLILAFVGAAAAVTTGLLDAEKIASTVPWHDHLDRHQVLAFMTSGLLAILVLWRVALRGAFPQRSPLPYLMLLLAAVITVGIGAYFGGLMVYSHGAGVEIVH